MTVAIHQPNYFPWLGFFYKIYASDVFVFHDNVEHSKRYPSRRTRIRKASGSEESCWLTVPLKKHSDFTLIKDLEIDHSQDWQGKHLRKIRNSYYGSPFFNEVFPSIESWFGASERVDSLAGLNIFLVKNILEMLGIEREIRWSSELPVEGKGSEYNVGLVKYLGGTVYLSGKGGSNYQSASLFEDVGITMIYSDFLGKTEKLELPFSPRISIVEALFEVGAEKLACFFDEIKSAAA
jgi:hypothetical protein